ncbi:MULTISPECIES: hypothetical protein [unclassified Capnocytophaga]|jgi:hypothetical protein|uniref:hypothetical protein n=1 Tax=unclassified Capnocytophaga TaxID=2640652 RepID=UPI000202BA0A|nr:MULTISPECIES: hypothetical protein [unclassified Capnocytophaga]EGD33458.1 hypothetical protein HMPREF9071_1953 [Capnocytophaga sp. oral taxon 338 str. F0234]MEB3004259.1 hypothetical protein [Capnocytophaga sp. G2]
MIEQFLDEYAQQLFTNVGGTISVSLVSTLDGSILAYKSREGVDNRLASSYQVEIFRNAILSFENTEGLSNKSVDDVCLVYEGQTHLIGLLQSKKILDHVILDDTANIGLAKLLIRKIRAEAESKFF